MPILAQKLSRIGDWGGSNLDANSLQSGSVLDAIQHIPAYIQKSFFFPDPGVTFEVDCDDGEHFQCVRAQANGKAIHTPVNNSLFGIYFRSRLGVMPGYTVTIEHLTKYGRSSVDFHKLSANKYFLDFSINQ